MGRPKKYGDVTLTDAELSNLKKIANSRNEKASKVRRAKILIMSYDGHSNTEISRKLGINILTAKLCIEKCITSGVDSALVDDSGRGRKASLTDDEKTWVKHIACKKPTDFGLSQELWTYSKLAKYVREKSVDKGYVNLQNASKSKIFGILNEAGIKPHKVRYYLEKVDPEFDEKMQEVLMVYKEVALELSQELSSGKITLSYDEKPGLQAIANKYEDKPPTEKHGFVARDYEYKRYGTVSLLAGINLLNGEVIPLVRDTHKSSDFIQWLNKVDQTYDSELKIRIILDNHSAHISKETRAYLKTRPHRFEFVFTPKHGSWLNIIEVFFAKMTRAFLRGLRVKDKEELVTRLYKYIDEINAEPVIFRWKYKMEEIDL